MKKTLSIVMISLIVLSTFSMFALQAKAEPDYQLTTDPHTEGQPSWSPNGEKIVYLYWTAGWYRYIKIMNNDGTNKYVPMETNVVDNYPAFSPDGEKIVFIRHGFRGDYWDLMMYDTSTGEVTRITDGPIPGKDEGSYRYPQWSEDGTNLVFHYTEGSTGANKEKWICTMNVTDYSIDCLDVRGMNPRFCCADTKIIFNTDPYPSGDNRIALMNADGTDVQILTDGPHDLKPHMSPATHRILFTRCYPEGGKDLYVMSEAGSGLRAITSDEMSGYGEWSPDEKYIVYVSERSGNQDIWKMEAPPARDVEQITDNTLDDFNPDIDLDSAGNPHISWVDTAGAYYGIKSGSSWDISQIITDPPIVGSIVKHFGPQMMSLCLDSQDRPHIAWAKPPSGAPAGIQVFYSYWTGSEWVTEQVTDWGDGVTQLHNVDLVLDSHDKPHIVWDSRVGLWGVFYSERDETEWTFEAISHYDNFNPSIAIDSNDVPHVVWQAGSSSPDHGLWFGSRVEGTWTSEQIVDGPATGYLAIDSSNKPHIAFIHNYDLFYGSKDSGSWDITEIAHGPDTIPYACIALDANDMPYVAWSSDASGVFDIYLAELEQQWITYNISSQPFDEVRPKIAVGTHGTVHLVWYGPEQLGQGESEIYYYTQTIGPPCAWRSTTPLPNPSANHHCTVHDNRIYVVGGQTPASGIRYDRVLYGSVQPDGHIDPDGWLYTTPLPEERTDPGVVTYEDWIYVLGGSANQPGRVERDTVWFASFNPDGTVGDWMPTTSLPYPVGDNAYAEWNGRIYLMGGWDGFSWHDDVYYAEINPDGSLGDWMPTTSLPEPRVHGHAAAVHNGVIYLFGGQYPADNYPLQVYYAAIEASGEVGAWEETTPLPIATGGHSALVYNDDIFIIGGKRGPPRIVYDTIYKAHTNPDGSLNSWIELTCRLPQPLFKHSSIVLHGRLYVIGGRLESGNLVDTVYFTDTGPPVVPETILFSLVGPQTDKTLISIDPTTAETSVVGKVGAGHDLEGLAFNPDDGFLYGSTGWKNPGGPALMRIDPTTGSGETVGRYTSSGGEPDEIDALSFHPITGVLYGVNEGGPPSGGQLCTIDINTGEATIIGDLGDSFGGGEPGIAFDSTGTLYGVSAGSDQLFTINITTGKATDIGPLGFDNVAGLDFNPETGVLYGVDRKSRELIAINTATGQGTLVGMLIGPVTELPEALAFMPVEMRAAISMSSSMINVQNAEYMSNFGTIAFDDTSYTLPESVLKDVGSYMATANPPDYYMFDQWQYSGGVSVSDEDVQTTTVTISGDGELTAVFKPKEPHLDLICTYFPYYWFSSGEGYYPYSFYGDLDDNVTNNLENYEPDLPHYIYIHEVEDAEYFTIQYWMYYAYSDVPWLENVPLDHEHDWDTTIYVTFRKPDLSTPVEVTYFRHNKHLTLPWWFVPKIEGKHPQVFVALGTHAAYATVLELHPGAFDKWFPGGKELGLDDFSWILVFGNGLATENGEDSYTLLGYNYVASPGYGRGFPHPGPPGYGTWNHNGYWADRYLPEFYWPPVGLTGADPAPWQRTAWRLTLPPPPNVIEFGAASPVDIHLYDPLGRHLGRNYDTGEIENEIPNANYIILPEGQFVRVDTPIIGEYEIQLIGTSNGSYNFFLIAAINGSWASLLDSDGIVEGAVYAYSVNITDEAMTTTPDPVAELEHLKEFIMDLPNDVFVSDDPDEFAEFKKEMFDKIDEILEELQENKHTEAIEKLDDMKEEVTDEDKLQPTTQSDICVIIDHIISSIETLQQA